MPAIRRTPVSEFFWRMHAKLYDLTGGRFLGKIPGGMPVLLLTTKGRKSGQPRTVALTYLPKGDASVVIASNGGDPQYPAWWLNLAADANAEVRRGSQVLHVRAREAEGEERERYWNEVVAIESGYDQYRQWTTGKRRIPIVVLEPAR